MHVPRWLDPRKLGDLEKMTGLHDWIGSSCQSLWYPSVSLVDQALRPWCRPFVVASLTLVWKITVTKGNRWGIKLERVNRSTRAAIDNFYAQLSLGRYDSSCTEATFLYLFFSKARNLEINPSKFDTIG